MSNIEDIIEDDNFDILTSDEQDKINSIPKVSFVPVEKNVEKNVEEKSSGFWSVFDIFKIIIPNDLAAVAKSKQTLQALPFNFQRRVGLDKIVTINNISGTNAYIILTSVPITTVKTIGLSGGAAGLEGNLNLEFEDKGEYKAQKLSIANNTSSEYELDNSKFYCTLFLNVDGQWKKSWDNRRFNGKRFDINILEKHVKAALDKDNIPDF